MGIYLEDHPPRVRQFRQRYARPTGCIVVHTAESIMDTVGEDTGAENVAGFIANRTDPGSYHTICDSNSRVRLVRFNNAAYGDGTGSNEWAIHISFACSAHQWAGMTPQKRQAFIRQGARAAAEAARWLKSTYDVDVPAVRITRAQSDDGKPGFISHAERDPERRTDPGSGFPWLLFLTYFRELMEDDDMNEAQERQLAETHESVQRIERWLAKEGVIRGKLTNVRTSIGKLREAGNGNKRDLMARIDELENEVRELQSIINNETS